MTQPIFNGMFAALMSSAVIAGVSAGAQTLSPADYKNPDNQSFYVTGADDNDGTVNLPQGVQKVSVWQSDPANAHNVTIWCGTGSVTLTPGQRVTLITDGTANGISASELTGSVSTLAWQPIDDDTTAIDGDHLDLQSTAATFTVTFPADPIDFATVYFSNEDGSLGTHAITLDGNGHQLGSPAAGWTDSRTISTAYARFAFRFFGDTWSIL